MLACINKLKNNNSFFQGFSFLRKIPGYCKNYFWKKVSSFHKNQFILKIGLNFI